MTDNPGLSEHTFDVPLSFYQWLAGVEKDVRVHDLTPPEIVGLKAAFAQPPASGVDRSREAVDPPQEDIERARKFLRGLRRPTINRNVPEGVALQAMFEWHKQESRNEGKAVDLAGVGHAEEPREVGIHPSSDRRDGGGVRGSGSSGPDGNDGAGTLEIALTNSGAPVPGFYINALQMVRHELEAGDIPEALAFVKAALDGGPPDPGDGDLRARAEAYAQEFAGAGQNELASGFMAFAALAHTAPASSDGAGAPAGMVLVSRDLLEAAVDTYEGEWGEANSPDAWPNRMKAILAAAPKQATPTDEAVLGERGASLIFDAVWERFCEGDFELEVNDLITGTALSCGLVKKIPFDPEEHIDVTGACEPGDDYYMLTEAGEKLISSAKAPESPAPGSGGEADHG